MTTGFTLARGRLGPALLVVLLVTPLVAALLWMLWRVPYGWETISILEDLETRPLAELIGVRGAYFRPLFWLALWSVWDGIPAAGQALATYNVLHGATIVLLITTFLAALAPRTLLDALVAGLAAAVLIGSPGFRENLENLPLNQTIVVMLAAVLSWIIVERPHRAWHGPALVVLAIVAIGFKEQGLIVVAMMVAAWAIGAPGVRRPTAIVLLGISLAYLGLRIAAPEDWPVFAQSVGVGFEDLSPGEAEARYGAFPIRIYIYNVMATAANVLFSEPTRGVFAISKAATAGDLQPWQVNHLVSSTLMTTLLLFWAVALLRNPTAKGPSRLALSERRDSSQVEGRLAILLAVAVAGSAALGFNYTRDRFGGVAAVFYGFASFFAVRWLIASTMTSSRVRMAAGLTLVLASATAWNLRAVGTVQGLRETAWSVRREWIVDVPERRRKFADRPAYLAVIDALYDQGGDPRVDAPRDPRRLTRFLGDW